MLRELHVRNLAVLAGASVELGAGLNVLTGETGAGKSIVVDSLLLLAGGRANSDLIRTGADSLTVTGVFEPAGDDWRQVLDRAGLAEEPDGTAAEILIRREVSRSGRNRVFVNDQPSTLRLLSELAPFLLRIHGQREEMGLMAPDLQRSWLDRSGGEKAEELLARTAEAHETYARLAARMESLTGDGRARVERIDLLRFQAAELEAADLRAGEEDELRAEREQLRNHETIRRNLDSCLSALFEDEDAAVDRLGRGRGRLEEVAEWEPDAAAWCEELEELRIRTEELSSTLRQRLERLDADPRRLDDVEDRLAVLERLCRKHGRSTAELIQLHQEIVAELAVLEGDEDDVDSLRQSLEATVEVYRKVASALSDARERWGRELVRRVAEELSSLGLAKARLEVSLTPRRRSDSPLRIGGEAVDFGVRGFDQVTFLFAANPGEEAQPLARVASGGELSRIYLALQLATRGDREVAAPTLVFDEVDTGIGGAEAAAVGRKLKHLSAGGQILAVTHLPQVACFGDRHFKVSKAVEGERTYARVDPLPESERASEIARMLAGNEVTKTSLRHARELLEGGRGKVLDAPAGAPGKPLSRGRAAG